MTDDAPRPLSAEEEAAEGWALIDVRFLAWHHRTCGVHRFKANRPECDCGLQATLDAARASAEPLDVLRAAAWRLCEAIADKAAIDGLVASGHSRDWKAQMDSETEFLDALKACRTACDGRPR